jgi:protein-disulfide isomerase
MTIAATRSSALLAGVVVLSLVSAGCAKQAPDPVLVARLDKLEARVVEQDKQLTVVRAQANSAELAILASKIEELTVKIAALEERLAKAPAPKPKRRGPDPAKLYAVPVGTSPVDGPATAKVTMVMAFDFACRYCRRAWDTIDELRKKYGKDLRVVYKQYVVHPDTAMYPARAACAAGRQGKFRTLAQLLWVKSFDANKFEDAHIDKLAKQAKLDLKRYRADVETCVAEVTDDGTLMKKLAVNATPTFFINGRPVEGAKPQADFEKVIDEELAKADAAIKAGTPADKIYELEVLGKGITEDPM